MSLINFIIEPRIQRNGDIANAAVEVIANAAVGDIANAAVGNIANDIFGNIISSSINKLNDKEIVSFVISIS